LRTREELGWLPMISLRDGLPQTIAQHRTYTAS
jgi:nucleoside-diphosphate-sugar epimerase